jgi:hypothetical protein
LSTLQEALVAAPITNAGKADTGPAPADPRKEAIRLIRTTLRKPDATDEYDAALEALAELSKD